MPLMILDPYVEARLKAERQERGIDQHDEVWDGVYTITPPKDIGHQSIRTDLCYLLGEIYGPNSPTHICMGVNVSDRDGDWEQNYRCPDLTVFLPKTSALNRHTHFVGGPDFTVEILSPNDLAREKLPFYSRVKVRELLIIDRNPWALELYRHDGRALSVVGRCTPDAPETLASRILPLSFALTPATPRPTILVTRHDSAARWNI